MERGAAFAVFEFDDVDALNQLGQKWGEYYFWPLVERRCLRSLAWLLNLNPGLALHTNAMSDRDNVLHNIARTRSKLSIGVLDSCKKMVRMFVQAGTPINARNFCGSTPIHALWSNVQKADPWILAMTRIFIDCGSRPIAHNSETQRDYAHKLRAEKTRAQSGAALLLLLSRLRVPRDLRLLVARHETLWRLGAWRAWE